ncbi:MAG: MerR family transcriptional regulator [Acidimicrobiales bacterium]
MEPGEVTIDQLAVEADMTVRNIRAHQSRGLLPPPRLVGRTGYYGPGHLRRLRHIKALQDEGLNLRAIAHALRDGSLSATAAGVFSAAEPGPSAVDAQELADRLHLDAGDPAVGRAFDLGMISVDGDQVRVELPRLVWVAEQLADQGVPLAAMLDVIEVVRRSGTQAAEAFMALADEHLVARVALDTGGELGQVRAAVERLRALAGTALQVLFDQAMADAVRRYFDGAMTLPPACGDRP